MEQNLIALGIILILVVVVLLKTAVVVPQRSEFVVERLGKLAKENNTMIVPGNLTDLSGMVALAMATFQHLRQEGGDAGHSEIRLRC